MNKSKLEANRCSELEAVNTRAEIHRVKVTCGKTENIN